MTASEQMPEIMLVNHILIYTLKEPPLILPIQENVKVMNVTSGKPMIISIFSSTDWTNGMGSEISFRVLSPIVAMKLCAVSLGI